MRGLDFKHLGIVCITLVHLAMVSGCQRAEPEEDPRTKIETKVVPPTVDPAQATTAVVKEGQILLTAEINGDKLEFTLFNYTDRMLIVGPKYFALLFPDAPKADQVVPFGKYETGFQATKLASGDSVVGHFSIRRHLSNIEGAFLIFNHPDAGLVKFRIK